MQDASVNYVANTLPKQAAVAGAVVGVGVAVATAPTWVPPVLAAATSTAAKYGPEIMATAKMIETIGSPGPTTIDDAPLLVSNAPLSHPDFIGSIIGGIQEKWSDIKSFFSGSSTENN